MLLGAVVLAGTGHLALPVVVLIAIAGAILGSCLGYVIGRRGGRRLLLRPGPFVGKRHRMLHGAERFFSRYGEAAVFFPAGFPVRATSPRSPLEPRRCPGTGSFSSMS